MKFCLLLLILFASICHLSAKLSPVINQPENDDLVKAAIEILKKHYATKTSELYIIQSLLLEKGSRNADDILNEFLREIGSSISVSVETNPEFGKEETTVLPRK